MACGLAVAVGGCEADVCDAEALQRALDDAVPGIVVEARACRYDGALEVPTGVTLRGVPGRTIVASAGDVAVRLGQGATLEGVEVRVEAGRGVEARATAALRDVTIRGPVDRALADMLPPTPSASTTATHGLVLVSAGSPEAPVELERVEVQGFARFGVLAIDSHLRWVGGGTRETLGTGVLVRGGAATLRELDIGHTWRGLSLHGYGAVLTSDARIDTEALAVHDNDAVGVLHDAVTAEHRELVADDNSDAGVWVQRSSRFVLADGELAGNALAGLVLIETTDATVRDTRITATRRAITILPDVGEVEVGDGLQAVLADASGLRLERVTLGGNERVGLLLQIASGSVPAGALREVVVDAEGAALGAVAQTESTLLDPAAWSDGIERRGAAAVNDAAAVDRLSVLGAVAPMFLPPPEP